MHRPQQDPDDSSASRRANYLFVLVAGVLIGATVMALIVSSRCEAGDRSPRYVDSERLVTREVQKVVDVPRVVTRVVTKEVDSPRVVTRMVEADIGTTTSAPTRATSTPFAQLAPPAPTLSLDAESCELWRDYGAELAPLASGLVEILAEERELYTKLTDSA